MQSGGHSVGVHVSDISDIAALPVRFGAAVRHRRLFHPAGVLAEGVLDRVAPPDEGLPMTSCDVIARVSKGVGLPGAVPDVAGLAWRIPPPQDLSSCGPWDVLLASTIADNRFLLAPVASWSDLSLSSLMPLRYRGTSWWVRARLVSEVDAAGLSVEGIAEQIASRGVVFDVEQAAGSGEFLPLARLTLRFVDPSRQDIAFDPVLHSHDDVELAPRWLREFRRAAYLRSRQGRAGDEAD
ncbi:phosphodiesterase [Mycolicibacterium sp. XJ1819]